MDVPDLINKEKNWSRYFPREMYTTELFQAFMTWFLKLAKKRFNFVYLNNLEKKNVPVVCPFVRQIPEQTIS